MPENDSASGGYAKRVGFERIFCQCASRSCVGLADLADVEQQQSKVGVMLGVFRLKLQRAVGVPARTLLVASNGVIDRRHVMSVGHLLVVLHEGRGKTFRSERVTSGMARLPQEPQPIHVGRIVLQQLARKRFDSVKSVPRRPLVSKEANLVDGFIAHL